MRIEDLEQLTTVPLDRAREVVRPEEEIASLPVQEHGRDEDSVIVATPARMLVITERPWDPEGRVDVERFPWTYVEAMPWKVGSGFEGEPERWFESVSIRVGRRVFEATFADPGAGDAIRQFLAASPHISSIGRHRVGCEDCGQVGWVAGGREVRSITVEGNGPTIVGLIEIEPDAEGPWVGKCGHAVREGSRLEGFLASLKSGEALALLPNR